MSSKSSQLFVTQPEHCQPGSLQVENFIREARIAANTKLVVLFRYIDVIKELTKVCLVN